MHLLRHYFKYSIGAPTWIPFRTPIRCTFDAIRVPILSHNRGPNGLAKNVWRFHEKCHFKKLNFKILTFLLLYGTWDFSLGIMVGYCFDDLFGGCIGFRDMFCLLDFILLTSSVERATPCYDLTRRVLSHSASPRATLSQTRSASHRSSFYPGKKSRIPPNSPVQSQKKNFLKASLFKFVYLYWILLYYRILLL